MYKNYRNIFLQLLMAMFLLFNSCEKEKRTCMPVDGDGNEYDTVIIGTQTWLKENLKTTSYINGDPIYLITDNDKWTNWKIGAYCWYNNDIKNKDVYGALYNSYAAKLSNSLCPVGWHIPTASEWRGMFEYLGGNHYAGGKLKETGTTHWISESQGTTNETGFTALPGGFRYLDGIFQDIRVNGFWWMSDIDMHVLLHHSTSSIGEGALPSNQGFSIRCIKDK